ncbi:MAG: hypothetical protein HY744_28520 [Deltaproteobacteria bacterium]|nr:hypothetical protein [Deltaproteobacteria bacterium]
MRLWKCEAWDVLRSTEPVRLCVAGHVAKEFRAQGPAQRAAFLALGLEVCSVKLGSAAFVHLARLRGGRPSTRDLGEDESLAVALAAIDAGERVPFVSYDHQAARRAGQEGIVTLDFLDSLAWLVGCGTIEAERADQIARTAHRVDGWRPHPGYAGGIEIERLARQSRMVEAVARWSTGEAVTWRR